MAQPLPWPNLAQAIYDARQSGNAYPWQVVMRLYQALSTLPDAPDRSIDEWHARLRESVARYEGRVI